MDKKLHEKALELWREREMTFPTRVRRMNPDAIDMASGAWHLCLAAAALRLKTKQTVSGPPDDYTKQLKEAAYDLFSASDD